MRLRFGPVRICPTCAKVNRATNGFCPDCGASLANVPILDQGLGRTTAAIAPQSAFFSVPAYLHVDAVAARRARRPSAEAGGGGGFVWVGSLSLGGSLIGSTDAPWARVAWAAGIVLAIVGYWRMRHDLATLERVGLTTAGVAAAILGVVGGQLVASNDFPEDRRAARVVQPTVAPDWGETATAQAASGTAEGDTTRSSVTMFRGGPARTGVHAGPGPAGGPALAWKLDTAGEVYSSPAVADGVAYLGTKSGFLYAVDVATGAERWRADLGDSIIRSSPAVVDRTVYVGAGFALVALDAETGEERWRYATRYAGQSSPVVVDGTVYIGSQEQIVYAVDARSGEKKWEYAAGGVVFSSPAVDGGALFFGGDDGHLYCLDAATGRFKWKFAAGGAVYASPAVDGGVVYVTATSHFLYAVDAASGQERWRFGVGGEASPAVADGVVYVGADDGGLYAIDTETHVPRWLVATGKPIRASPVITGDTVYVGSGSVLYAVNRADGAKRWTYAAGDDLISSPTVADGLVLAGGRDGFLYAVGGNGITDPQAS